MQRIYFLILILLISGCTTLPTVDSLQQWHGREVRLAAITRNILVSNLQICPEHRKDYGFKAIWISHKNRQVRKVWEEAFGIQKTPIILTITQNAAADRAGLLVGDKIMSVNGTRWSAYDRYNLDFIEGIYAAQLAPTMLLEVGRNIPNETEMISVTGDDVCDVDVILVDDAGAYAYAQGNRAYIEAGLEELLREDDELAFVIAHEVAHIILGHVAPGIEKDVNYKSSRPFTEKEADEMAVRLMLGAGYDPAAATGAIRKFDHANRGLSLSQPDIYGLYMPTEQRVEFLKAYVAKLGE